MAQYDELQESVVKGDVDKVSELVKTLHDSGSNPKEIMLEGLVGGISLVGEKWKKGDMFIPEVLLSAQAVKQGTNILKSFLLAEEEFSSIGKVVIGTVHSDLHNIGKNIVAMILESVGFTVLDLGVDVPTEKFVEAVKEEQPDILGLSTLMNVTLPMMKDVIDGLERASLRDKVKVMVGGAAVTQAFADSIGAEFAPDAITAADKAKQLLGL